MFDHNITTLKGICAGVLADGELNQDEAEFLLTYLSTAPASFLEKYPANILADRLVISLEDGLLDNDEMHDLLKILLDIINGIEPKTGINSDKTVNIPGLFDDCNIEFEQRTFVVTGTFETASRGEIEKFIQSKGGLVNKKTVTKVTDYVVVGGIVSKDWVAGNYGRKIEQAVKYRDQGLPVKILSENHWLSINTH
ncbi:MAG: BRCT domain-containing protein [Flavobacteriales bacterium]